MDRKIIHIDMDAFYASIEERDDPTLKGRPVVVGGSPNKRGVVATANYEARKYGIRSAISSRTALKLCPEVLFIQPRFNAYKEASEIIREVLHEFTELIEPLSLDEAYLDVSEESKSHSSTGELALEIKRKIFEKTKLTSSAGVAPNKLIAKIASDYKKPNGLTVVSPRYIQNFLDPLPVRSIPGVGPVTENKLLQNKITKISDLKIIDKIILVEQFGKTGHWLFDASRGIDERPVLPIRTRKSLSVEDTFNEDILDQESIETNLQKIALTLSNRLQEKSISGRTITLKVTYSDFTKITRSLTLDQKTNSVNTLYEVASQLAELRNLKTKSIRLLGIGVSNLNSNSSLKKQVDSSEYQLSFLFN